MKTKLLIAFLMSAALAACGGKAKKSTTPENKGGSSAGSMGGAGYGGASYGGAMKPGAGSAMTPKAGGDPCGG